MSSRLIFTSALLKTKAKTSSITLKTAKKTKKVQGLYIILVLRKNVKSLGGWAMANATETTFHPTGHMTHTQAPAACEKNIFHLFRFTQPVNNYTLIHLNGFNKDKRVSSECFCTKNNPRNVPVLRLDKDHHHHTTNMLDFLSEKNAQLDVIVVRV